MRGRGAIGTACGPGIAFHVGGKVQTLALEAHVEGHTIYLMRAL